VKPVDFSQRNAEIAKHQDEYQTLFAYENDRETISCWRFSFWERVIILLKGRLWLRQMNFRSPLQPQLPSVKSPFIK
jgi:hypothetical protein